MQGMTATGTMIEARGERGTVRCCDSGDGGAFSTMMPNWPSATEDIQSTMTASISARKHMGPIRYSIAALCDTLTLKPSGLLVMIVKLGATQADSASRIPTVAREAAAH